MEDRRTTGPRPPLYSPEDRAGSTPASPWASGAPGSPGWSWPPCCRPRGDTPPPAGGAPGRSWSLGPGGSRGPSPPRPSGSTTPGCRTSPPPGPGRTRTPPCSPCSESSSVLPWLDRAGRGSTPPPGRTTSSPRPRPGTAPCTAGCSSSQGAPGNDHLPGGRGGAGPASPPPGQNR